MKLNKELLLKLYRNLVRTRYYDELFTRLLAQGKLLGFYHQSLGQEAPGVGACSILHKDDIIITHLRGHGLPYMIGKGIEPKYFLAEHLGKSTGMCRGVSTFHRLDSENGLYGHSGLIGSGFPLSVGFGLAAKKNGRRQITACFFGDGGSNRGTLHESLLMSNNWKLPVIYVCENNGVAQFVPFEDTYPVKDIADLAHGYGMPGIVVDGQDVIAVAEAMGAAVERAREGKGPSLIECKTSRFCPHFVSAPDMFGCEMRAKEEIEELKKRDPIELFRKKLMARKILTEKDVERINNEAIAETDAAVKFADESPIPDPSILDELLYAN
jgi:pyruvate dehydrogenase E1 component alpha subunit